MSQENAKTLQKAVRLLQMPPFLAPRVKTETILATDEKLSPLNLTNTNIVFTDISLNVPNKVSIWNNLKSETLERHCL
jgi:hypothetical protein